MIPLKPHTIKVIEDCYMKFGVSALVIDYKTKRLEAIQFRNCEHPIDVQSLVWTSSDNRKTSVNQMHSIHIQNILVKHSNNEFSKNINGLRTYQWIAILLIEKALREERFCGEIENNNSKMSKIVKLVDEANTIDVCIVPLLLERDKINRKIAELKNRLSAIFSEIEVLKK